MVYSSELLERIPPMSVDLPLCSIALSLHLQRYTCKIHVQDRRKSWLKRKGGYVTVDEGRKVHEGKAPNK